MNRQDSHTDTAEGFDEASATYIPSPGQGYGPCLAPCRHRSCQWQRTVAAQPCALCVRPMGFDVQFCENEGDVAHAICVDDDLDAQDRRDP